MISKEINPVHDPHFRLMRNIFSWESTEIYEITLFELFEELCHDNLAKQN